MVTLTKVEIQWILNLVVKDRDSNKALMSLPEQEYAALHELRYENMASLAEKLEETLKTEAKRIAIGGVVR